MDNEEFSLEYSLQDLVLGHQESSSRPLLMRLNLTPIQLRDGQWYYQRGIQKKR